MKIKGAN